MQTISPVRSLTGGALPHSFNPSSSNIQTTRSEPGDRLQFGQKTPKVTGKIRKNVATRLIATFAPLLALSTGCGMLPADAPTQPGDATSAGASNGMEPGINWDDDNGFVETPDVPMNTSQPTATDPLSPSEGIETDVPDWLNDTPVAEPTNTVPTVPVEPTSTPPAPATPTEPPSTPSTTEPSATPTQDPPKNPTHPPKAKPQTYMNLMSQNVWSTHWPAARKNWPQRMVKIAQIAQSNRVDVLTTQETEPNQFRKLKQALGSQYRSFPQTYDKHKMAQRTIFYKVKDAKGRRVWDVKQSGSINIPDYDDRTLTHPTRRMPWVRLMHAQTGQEIVVLSIHATAWDMKLDLGGALKREKAAHVIADWAKTMKSRFPDAVVIASGDINARDYIRKRPQRKMGSSDLVLGNDRSRLLPCIIGKELRAVDNLAAHRPGTCPITSTSIDRAFSNASKAKKFRKVYRGQSDHGAMLVNIKLKKQG